MEPFLNTDDIHSSPSLLIKGKISSPNDRIQTQPMPLVEWLNVGFFYR